MSTFEVSLNEDRGDEYTNNVTFKTIIIILTIDGISYPR